MSSEKNLDYFQNLWDSAWAPDLRNMKRNWDKRSGDWDLKYREGSSRKQQSEQRIIDTAQFLIGEGLLEKNFDVADIGCGPGRFAAEFAKTAHSVLGLDISDKMAEYGRIYAREQGLENVSFLSGDFHEMDLQALGLTGKFDLAFSSITPAVGGLKGLDNFIAMSRKWCCNICFVHYQNDLNDRILRDVFSRPPRKSKTGHSEWFWELFNLLYLRGYYPKVSYYRQERQTRQAADSDTAEYLAWYLLPQEEHTSRSIELILRYLQEHAGPDGTVSEYSDCVYARTLWDVNEKR